MNLEEAKKILESQGILLKEYSPFGDPGLIYTGLEYDKYAEIISSVQGQITDGIGEGVEGHLLSSGDTLSISTM